MTLDCEGVLEGSSSSDTTWLSSWVAELSEGIPGFDIPMEPVHVDSQEGAPAPGHVTKEEEEHDFNQLLHDEEEERQWQEARRQEEDEESERLAKYQAMAECEAEHLQSQAAAFQQWEDQQMQAELAGRVPPKRRRCVLTLEVASGSQDRPTILQTAEMEVPENGTLTMTLRAQMRGTPESTSTIQVPRSVSGRAMECDQGRLDIHLDTAPDLLPSVDFAEFEKIYKQWRAGTLNGGQIRARYGGAVMELLEAQMAVGELEDAERVRAESPEGVPTGPITARDLVQGKSPLVAVGQPRPDFGLFENVYAQWRDGWRSDLQVLDTFGTVWMELFRAWKQWGLDCIHGLLSEVLDMTHGEAGDTVPVNQEGLSIRLPIRVPFSVVGRVFRRWVRGLLTDVNILETHGAVWLVLFQALQVQGLTDLVMASLDGMVAWDVRSMADIPDESNDEVAVGSGTMPQTEMGVPVPVMDTHLDEEDGEERTHEAVETSLAALKTIAGLQSTSWTAEEALDLELYFTRVKAIQGTDAGNWLAERVRVDFATLKKMIAELKEGATNVEEVGEAWLPAVAPGLFDADLVLCSEPLWLCPFVRPRHGRTMVGVLHMALLNEFPAADDVNLRVLWRAFKDMVEAQRIYLSISCRITAEQVAYQTGWRLPYVPFVGLGIRVRYHPAEARRALLFRNNRQNMLTFRKALRMFLQEVATDSPVEVVDMNSGPRVYTFQEIAAFHAVIFLPHGPSALRLTDVYAAGIPSLVPEEPMSHKFIWSSRTFGGYDAERHCLSVAPPEFRRGGAEEPFAYHPTHYLQSWAIHRFIDDRRYWYRYTEWATLPHLLPFVSLPSLVETLGTLTRERGLTVSALMAQHHALMVTDALSWWRAALADALAQGEPWETRKLQVLQGLGK
ncbi:unnamed protein product [Symbiodinium sp. CCMP2592]|nr:unnamed protein product [Symbiodinium sp. CCMP2592]